MSMESSFNFGLGTVDLGREIAQALNDQGMRTNYQGLETHGGHEPLHNQITMYDPGIETIKLRFLPPSGFGQ